MLILKEVQVGFKNLKNGLALVPPYSKIMQNFLNQQHRELIPKTVKFLTKLVH